MALQLVREYTGNPQMAHGSWENDVKMAGVCLHQEECSAVVMSTIDLFMSPFLAGIFAEAARLIGIPTAGRMQGPALCPHFRAARHRPTNRAEMTAQANLQSPVPCRYQ